MPPYENFSQDLEQAKALKTELDLAIQKAKETGKTQEAETLAQKTQAHLEQMEGKLWPFEQELPQKEIQEQYASQKEILARNNLLEPLPDGTLGITGIDQKAYPFPTFEQIKKELQKNPELKTKMEQGFTELQITPFALPLSKLTETVSRSILKHKKENKLFTAKKDPNDQNEQLVPLELDENQPLWIWDQYQDADTNNNLVYFPKEFNQTNHQGQTKAEILKTKAAFPGYLVTLQEKNSNIPRENQGATNKDRKQLEANLTPIEYLQKLQTDPAYQKESGTTPEEWLMRFLAHLETTDQVIDDYQGNGSVAYNLAGYFPASGHVPYAYWYRDDRRAYLYRDDAGFRISYVGARSAVRVGLGI
jgi:hypothetical protein